MSTLERGGPFEIRDEGIDPSDFCMGCREWRESSRKENVEAGHAGHALQMSNYVKNKRERLGG